MNLDLTTATEAAARAEYEATWESLGGASWDDDPDEDNRAEWRRTTAAAVAAAAPLIAAQVAERIAAEILAEASAKESEGLLADETYTGRTVRLVKAEGMKDAARIAREAVR
jgi:hypothetical protein